MSRDFGEGLFKMSEINDLSQIKDLSAAKAKATSIVDGCSATDPNKQKAMKLIHGARSTKSLLIGMANFSLSHQGMKVIR